MLDVLVDEMREKTSVQPGNSLAFLRTHFFMRCHSSRLHSMPPSPLPPSPPPTPSSPSTTTPCLQPNQEKQLALT